MLMAHLYSNSAGIPSKVDQWPRGVVDNAAKTVAICQREKGIRVPRDMAIVVFAE